eukprot:scaffold159502_cov33-Tisochrysis_lutea.AAC.7
MNSNGRRRARPVSTSTSRPYYHRHASENARSTLCELQSPLKANKVVGHPINTKDLRSYASGKPPFCEEIREPWHRDGFLQEVRISPLLIICMEITYCILQPPIEWRYFSLRHGFVPLSCSSPALRLLSARANYNCIQIIQRFALSFSSDSFYLIHLAFAWPFSATQ